MMMMMMPSASSQKSRPDKYKKNHQQQRAKHQKRFARARFHFLPTQDYTVWFHNISGMRSAWLVFAGHSGRIVFDFQRNVKALHPIA